MSLSLSSARRTFKGLLLAVKHASERVILLLLRLLLLFFRVLLLLFARRRVVVWAAVPARCVAASRAKPSITFIAFIAFIMDSPWSLTSCGSVFQISGVITGICASSSFHSSSAASSSSLSRVALFAEHMRWEYLDRQATRQRTQQIASIFLRVYSLRA